MLRKKKRSFRVGFIILLLIPVVSFAAWYFQDVKPLSVLVIDKTVPFDNFQEHRTFMMLLKNQKWVKPNGEYYDLEEDYKGFFPHEKPSIIVNDLDECDSTILQKMADTLQVLYLADSYGVYTNEWYRNKDIGERSKLVYGGSSAEDAYLTRQMVERNKLVLGEFNIFATPTRKKVREQFEDMFGVTWTGWVGRFFEDLKDTASEDLPRWVMDLYQEKYQTEEWPFKRGGMVFVHSSDDIVILDQVKDMGDEVWPIIYTLPTAQRKYELPSSSPYPFWFDIVKPKKGTEVLAQYQLFVSDTGLTQLKTAGIPVSFPALIRNNKSYYMAGDFVDNDLPNGLWMYMYGMYEYYNFLPVNTPGSVKTRKAFFRHYYYPFIKNVIEQEVFLMDEPS